MRRSQRDLETEKNALIFREKNAIKSLRERAKKAHSPEELRPEQTAPHLREGRDGTRVA